MTLILIIELSFFQADEAKIGYLKEEMCTLLTKFMGKFVKAKVIQSTEDLTAVPFEDSNSQLNDNIIAIGVMTRAYMVDHKDDIQPASLQRFFGYVFQSPCLILILS